MTDIEKISKYVNDNVYLIDNINHISEHAITCCMYQTVMYNNDLFDNKLKSDIQSFRFYILTGYESDKDKYQTLFRIFLFHIINKYYNSLKNIQFTLEIKNYFLDLINNCNVAKSIKNPVNIANKSGLILLNMRKLLQHHQDIHFNPISINLNSIGQILDVMCDLEDICVNKYGLFRMSVQGANGCGHCNLFLFDYKLQHWFRIEPAGIFFADDENQQITKQYSELDKNIKNIKCNYSSQNDYYYLPGMHFVNPGPYCAYYAIMIVETYITNNNMFETIEKVTSIDYINNKLKEYETLLHLKISIH